MQYSFRKVFSYDKREPTMIKLSNTIEYNTMEYSTILSCSAFIFIEIIIKGQGKETKNPHYSCQTLTNLPVLLISNLLNIVVYFLTSS